VAARSMVSTPSIRRWAARLLLAAILASSSCDGDPCNYCSSDRTVLTTVVTSEQRASLLHPRTDFVECQTVCESAFREARIPDAPVSTGDAGPPGRSGLAWRCDLLGTGLTCTGVTPCPG